MNRLKTLYAMVLAIAVTSGAAERVASGGEVETTIFRPEGAAGVQLYGVVKTAKDAAIAVGERGTVATLTVGRHVDEVELDLATVGSSALTAVCAWPNGALVIMSQAGVIWRRDNAGDWVQAQTETAENTAMGREPLFNCWCGTDGIGLAVGAFGTALRTEDYGRHWAPVSVNDDDDYHLYDIYQNQDDVVIVGEAGRIYRSGDLGKSWRRDVSPYSGSLFNALVGTEGDAIALGLRGTILARPGEAGEWRVLRAAGRSEAYFAAIQDDDSVLLGGATGDIDRLRNGEIGHVFNLPGRPSVMELVEVDGLYLVVTTDGLSVLKF